MRAFRKLCLLALVFISGLASACGSGGASDGGTGGGSGGGSGGGGGGSGGSSGSVTFSGAITATVTPANGTITGSVVEIDGGLPDGGIQSGLSLSVVGTLADGGRVVFTNNASIDLPFATGTYAVTAAGEPVSFSSSTTVYEQDGGSITEEWEEDYQIGGSGTGNGAFSVTITSTGPQSTIFGAVTYPTVHGSFSSTLIPEGDGDAGVSVTGTF